MEWITDYWYVLVLGLVAVMVLFGFKIKDNEESNTASHLNESNENKKENKSGHSCCH